MLYYVVRPTLRKEGVKDDQSCFSALPAAQKGMEKAAAAMLPAAMAEAVQTPIPTFQVAAKPAKPSFSRETREAGGMSILILPLLSLTRERAPGG